MKSKNVKPTIGAVEEILRLCARLRDGWAAPAGFAAALAALLLLLAWPGTTVVNSHSNDIYLPIDAAWKTVCGLVPHLDFYSPIGALYFLEHGLALKLSGSGGGSIRYAPFLGVAVLAAPACAVVFRRGGGLWSCLVLSWIWIPPVSPQVQGETLSNLAWLSDYNTQSWSVLALAAVWAVLPPRNPSPKADAAEAAAIGLLLAALAYLKATSFLAGCGLAVLCAWRGSPRAACIAAAAASAPILCVQAFAGEFHAAYLSDLVQAAKSARTYGLPLLQGWKLAADAAEQPFLLAAVLACAGALAAGGRGRQGGAIAAAAFGFLLASNQTFIGPVAGMAALACCGWSALSGAAGKTERKERGGTGMAADGDGAAQTEARGRRAMASLRSAAAIAAVAAAAIATAGLWADAVSAGVNRIDLEGDAARTASAAPGAAWGAAKVDFMNPPGDPASWTLPPPGEIVLDGMEGLRTLGAEKGKIAALVFSNPFPAALGSPPARGGAAWWHIGRNVADEDGISGEQAIGDADAVLEPLVHENMDTSLVLIRKTESTLKRGFTPALTTRWWRIWLRNPAPSPQSAP